MTGAPQPAAAPPPGPTGWRAFAYILAATSLALTQGLGMNLISANLPQIQGSLGATTIESTWLVAAYMAPNVSLSLILVKVRTQFGLRRFAEIGILIFVLVALLHLIVIDLPSAIIVRFFAGMAASPLSTLAFLYMLEAFPPARKLTVGLCLALMNLSLGAPLARLVSTDLLQIGQWHGLYLIDIALALISFGAVYLLPLTPPPRAKVISWLDLVSYGFIAAGFGAFAVVLVQGRLYWWLEAPWIGIALASGIACVAIAAMIELNRKDPLVDVRWITSKEILHFAGALLLVRVVLSEQATGASGFFQQVGLNNDQTHAIYGVILIASILGGLACAAVMKVGREPAIHALALILLTIGAYLDSQATNLTRPEQMYVSQGLIAFGAALFLPPAVSTGFIAALKKGPTYILSFIVVFLSTQSLGGLLGSAIFGSFVTWREKFHSSNLVEHINLADPMVAQRLSQLGGAYSRVLTDKTLANAEGLVLLSQQATQEANILAYNDAFLLITVLSATTLAALLIHVGYLALQKRLTPVSA